MTCPNCKKIYNDHVTICISCGAELVPDDPEIRSEGVYDTPAQMLPAEENIAPQPPTAEKALINAAETSTLKSGNKVLKITAQLAVSLLLFLVVILFFCSFTLRQFTMEQNLSRAVRNFDLLGLPAQEILPLSAEETLGEAVAVMADGTGLDSIKIKSIYESSTIKEHLCSILGQYGKYLRDGTYPDPVTADTIKSLFSENISVISVWTGYVISDSDLALAYDYIDSMSWLIDSISVKSLEENFGGVLSFVRAFISVPVIIAEGSAAVLLIAIIAAITKSGRKTLLFSGVSFLLAGLILTGAVFMFTMQIGVFAPETSVTREIMRSISYAMSEPMYAMGAIAAAAGGVLLIWSLTLKKAAEKTSPSGQKSVG